MIQLFANVIAMVVLGVIVWRRGRDLLAGSTPAAHWLRVAGLIPLAAQVAVYLFFGFGEMAGGDLSGAAHLLPAVAGVLFAFLAWRRPLEGGIALLAAAVLFALPLIASTVAAGPERGMQSAGFLIVAAPQLLSGALFLASGILAHRAASPRAA